jgi:hypothetical protein
VAVAAVEVVLAAVAGLVDFAQELVFLLQPEQLMRLPLALAAQQVQVAMVVLEEIQYFQPLPLQAVVMAAVLILLAAAAVRVVAVEKQRLEAPAIRHPPHHHKETMAAQHLPHLMAAAVAVAVQARLVAPQQILVAVDWVAMEQHLP